MSVTTLLSMPLAAAAGATGLLTEAATAADDPDGEERALWDGIR